MNSFDTIRQYIESDGDASGFHSVKPGYKITYGSTVRPTQDAKQKGQVISVRINSDGTLRSIAIANTLTATTFELAEFIDWESIRVYYCEWIRLS